MKSRWAPFSILLLLLLAAPACRRSPPPAPSLAVSVTLAQVTPSQLLPGERAVAPGQRYLVGTPGLVVTFRFPEPVNRGTVERAVQVEPQQAYQVQWASDLLLQVRVGDLPLDQPVHIGLREGARALSGATVHPVEFTVVRVEPPAVAAGVEGQVGVTSPGRYRLLAGNKTVRFDFTRPMDRAGVERLLLPQIDPRCQPSVRWESDQLAFLELDLLQGIQVAVSLLGWPDHRGVPVVEERPFVLEGVGTVRLVLGIPGAEPTLVSTLLDQFSQGLVSPDGRRVALVERFALDEEDEIVVWVLDLTTRALARLASFTDAGQFVLAWLPDSRHLVVNAGSRVVQLDTGGGEPRELVGADDGIIVGLAVAPRSGRVACFLAPAVREGAGVDLLITGARGTTTYPSVTRLYSREGFWMAVPCAWSPDEAWIAFTDRRSRSEAELTLIDPDKGGTRLLGGQAESIAFIPSGGGIAVRHPDGNWDLVDPDHGNRSPLLEAGEDFHTILWSRTGELACFARPEGGFAVWHPRQGVVTAPGQGLPLGWAGDHLLWITP